VLLKEEFIKPSNYLMGRVINTTLNNLNEVTSVTVLKSSTRELVYRHVTSLIYLFTPDVDVQMATNRGVDSENIGNNSEPPNGNNINQRQAAQNCKNRTQILAKEGLM